MTPDAFKPVQRLLDDRVSIGELMGELIGEICRGWPPDRFGGEPLPEPEWDKLQALDFDAEFLGASRWIHDALRRYPFPADVNGLYFGMIYPPTHDEVSSVALFLAGSRKFREDPDWARNADLPDDDFIYHPETLKRLYHQLTDHDNIAGTARDRAIYSVLVFTSLCVAEWSLTGMRHLLRGDCPKRGLFIGTNPWMGFRLEELEPDRPGGSGSVVITWSGRSENRRAEANAIVYLREIANWHEQRWLNSPCDRSSLRSMAELRLGGKIPERTPVRHFDEELVGRILVSPELADDPEELLSEARRHGVPIEHIDVNGSSHPLLMLDRLEVRGVEFRAYDVCSLYPMEDRLSFVFIASEKAPFLNGYIAALSDREFNAPAYVAGIQTADWFVQRPSVHLRDYFEEWAAGLLAWLRFFCLPGLRYSHRTDTRDQFDRLKVAFDGMQNQHGTPVARDYGFKRLRLEFEVEADRVHHDFDDG